jgi:hypothetical protein
MTRMIKTLPMVGWLLLALTVLATLILAAYVGGADAPVADEWRYVDPTIYLQDLFMKNNGHPLVIGRLGLALDYWLFDARGWALRAASFAFAASIVGAALMLARLAGHRSWQSQIAIGAFASIMLFNPQGAQNFTLGFQFIFVLVFAATAGAIAALAGYTANTKPHRLFLAYALSVVAALSLGNGIITPFILALMGWRLGLSSRAVLGFLALGGLSALALAAAPEIGSASERLPIAAPLDNIVYTLRVLGGAPALTISALTNADSLILALLFGIAGCAAAAWLGFRLWRTREKNPGRLGGAALMLFAIGSAAAIALVRAGAGGDGHGALTSRYVVVSALLLVGLALTAWPVAPKPAWRVHAFTALALAALTTVPFSAIAVIKSGEQIQRDYVRAESALVLGLVRPQALAAFATPELIAAQADVLRANGKWLFQDRWSRSIGQRIDTRSVRARCRGAMRMLQPSADAPQLAGIRGAVDASARGRIIVVADASGTMVGYGLKLRRAADLLPLLGENRADWFAMARILGPESAYTAYLASPDVLLCRIGRPARLSR